MAAPLRECVELGLEFIKADRAEIIANACILDAATLAPLLETLDADTAEYVAKNHDPLIAKFEAALARVGGG